MATRRIARGRGASPVPIIVLSVLLVGMVASTIVLSLEVGKKEVERDAAKAKEDQAKLDHRKLEQTREAYKVIVGLNLEGARDQLDRLRKDLADKAPITRLDTKEEVATPKTFENLVALLNAYGDRSQALEANEKYLQDLLDKSKTERTRLEGEVKAKEKEGQEQVEKEKKRAEDLDAAKGKVEGELAQVRKDLTAQIEVLKNEKVDLTKELSAAKKEADVLRKKVKELELRLKNIETAKNIRLLTPETSGPGANGRIVSVDADGQHVMIDMGRQDWVEIGMKFAVFDQADPDLRKQKGEIQVRKVFDVISQAKVLKQDPLDPILQGMVLIQPAFARGKTLEFVFEGRLKDPNLPRALQRYPCRLAKEVTEKTDYLVLGEADRKGNEPNPEDSANKKLADTKYKNSCIVMKERDLARYLGESD